MASDLPRKHAHAVSDLWREIASAAPLALYVLSVPWVVENDHAEGAILPFAGPDAEELTALRCLLHVEVCEDCRGYEDEVEPPHA